MAVPAGPGGGPVSPPGPLSSPRPRSGVSSACRGAGLGLAEPRKEGREGGDGLAGGGPLPAGDVRSGPVAPQGHG